MLDPESRDYRLTRRSLIRGASAAAVVGIGSAALAACGGPGSQAKGTTQNAKITLILQPNGTIPWSTTLASLYQTVLEPWLAQNKGVAVKLTPTLWGGNVQAILGGTASDVISDNYPPNYMSPTGNLLLKLDEFLKKDNISTTLWSTGQIDSYLQASPDHGLYMLPGYFSPMVYVVRLSDFDSAGYARPDPEWDYTAFQAAAKQMTDKSTGRVGAVIQWQSNTLAGGTYMFNAFDQQGMITPQGTLNLETPGNLQAGQWLYEQMFWPGYASTRDLMGPWYGKEYIDQDKCSIQLAWNGLVLDNAQAFNGFIWDYYLPPKFPQGPTCFGTDDFYGIASTTKYPEQAWSLLKFLTWDSSATGWQRQLMKIALLQPSLNSLWDPWIATVQKAAPPLQGKNLAAFKTMALNGRAYPGAYFPVDDSQAEGLTGSIFTSLWNQQLSVQQAWQQLDHVVNGMIQPALTEAAAELKTASAIASVQPGPNTNYPAPNLTGFGNPSTNASQYVVNSGGTWTLLGDGAYMGNTGTTDNCIFACQQVTATEGQWVCRVTGLANVSEMNSGSPAISNNVRIGLMARADLSDTAADMILCVTGSYGAEFMGRPAPGETINSQRFIWPKNNGIVQLFTSPPATPTPNFITKDVWLRLSRQGTNWSAELSLDGKTWTTAGMTSLPAQAMGGCWLGVFASAHNADFNSTGYIRATFDNLSTGFSPNKFVQIGQLGTPPSAGAVPSNWQTINVTASPAAGSSKGSSSKAG